MAKFYYLFKQIWSFYRLGSAKDQFKGVKNKEFDINLAKSKDPREIELIILKNRNGISGEIMDFEYYPRFNYFREV